MTSAGAPPSTAPALDAAAEEDRDAPRDDPGALLLAGARLEGGEVELGSAALEAGRREDEPTEDEAVPRLVAVETALADTGPLTGKEEAMAAEEAPAELMVTGVDVAAPDDAIPPASDPASASPGGGMHAPWTTSRTSGADQAREEPAGSRAMAGDHTTRAGPGRTVRPC